MIYLPQKSLHPFSRKRPIVKKEQTPTLIIFIFP